MIFIDVGANDGTWGIKYAEARPEATVLAFEPVPHLVEQIRARTKHLTNYFLFPIAIDSEPGRADFVVTAGNAGCSSLLPLRPQEELERVWVNRPDIKEVDRVKVEVARLDTILAEHGLENETIEFLHIDAQGKDWEVLKSLGDGLAKVVRGECEVALSADRSIYAGQEATVETVVPWLRARGFKAAVLPHLNFLEADIRFWRSGVADPMVSV